MTFAQIIGALLVVSPFAVLFAFIARSEGLGAALFVFGIAIIVIAVLIGGLTLLEG